MITIGALIEHTECEIELCVGALCCSFHAIEYTKIGRASPVLPVFGMQGCHCRIVAPCAILYLV